MVVGHVAPEAYVGGTIGLVHEGDSVTIDALQLLIQLNVDEAEIAKRRAVWKAPAPRYTRGGVGKVFQVSWHRQQRCRNRLTAAASFPRNRGERVRQGICGAFSA